MVSDREDRKETAQGGVSQGQCSTTDDKRKIRKREYRKERIQGQHLSHRQTSKTKDHTKISHRED